MGEVSFARTSARAEVYAQSWLCEHQYLWIIFVFLRACTFREDQAVVVLEDLKPIRNIGGTVLVRFLVGIRDRNVDKQDWLGNDLF